MSGITKITEQYGNNNYVAFEDNETNNRYLADRIENWGIIQFGSLNARQKKRIDLAEKGLTSAISIKSVYAFSSSTTNDEIRFRIFQKLDNGSVFQIANQRFDNNRMPYRFPDGAILSPGQIIEVEPKYDVDNLLIYFKPVHIFLTLEA